jgi:hypothetical protein
MSDIQTKRGRKPFVEEHFNQFLQVNKKTMKGVSDTSEAFDIYSNWAGNQERTMSQASFNKMFKIAVSTLVSAPAHEVRTRSSKMALVEQFDMMEQYVSLTARGIINSLFIYGLPGIGKTETVTRKLKSLKTKYEFFNGGVKDAYSIAKILYDNREGKVIVFDDFDSIFRNKNCIDILKIALADHQKRTITWADSTKRTKKDAVPLRFEFTSSIIFISNNQRFDKNLKNRSKIVHIDADKIECLEWVHDHFSTFLEGIRMDHKEIVYNFLKANIGKFRAMDYRTFKNAMVDFLICVDERSMDVNDSYWKKMIVANAQA